MSDETFNAAAGAVPEQGNVTPPESVELDASQGEDNAEPRVFSQEELDDIVAKRVAKAERKWQRDQAKAVSEPKPVVIGDAPRPEEFANPLDYAEALSDYKADKKIAERDAEKYHTTIESAYQDRVEKVRDKYDDYDDVVKNPSLRITDEMAEVIKASDLGPDLAYHLGSNPKEAARIAGLHPLHQARELGKIEASLIANPPAKKTTSAPDPITPVRRGSTNPAYDPTDPRSVKMDPKDWIKARNEQVAKRST